MQNKKFKSLLVTISDENYLDISKKFFQNIIKNDFWHNDLLLITVDEIADSKLQWFYNSAIKVAKYPYFFPTEIWYRTLPNGVKNPIVCSKLYLFSEYFKKWDKILYIDSDTIIRKPLNDIKNVNVFGAVQNNNNPLLHRHFDLFNKKYLNLYKALKKDYNIFSPAFNAGVFYFYPNKVESNIGTKFKALYRKYSPIATFSEQSILNLIFHDTWEPMPQYYNYGVSRDINRYNINPKRIISAILHFNGNEKPWDIESTFYEEWTKGFNYKKINSKSIINLDNHFLYYHFYFKIYVLLKKISSLNIKILMNYIFINYFPRLFSIFNKIRTEKDHKTN